MRLCSEPRCPVMVERPGKCSDHRKAASKARGTQTERGYGSDHLAERKRWEPRVATGKVPCAKCGVLIAADAEWHLGHSDDRTRWTGPEHVLCNLSAAGKTAGSAPPF